MRWKIIRKKRKFFETKELCFSLACYEDDGRSIMKTIDEFMKKNKLMLNRDVKNYLLQSLSNDRMISKQELEKIEIFSKNNDRKIKLEDIKIIDNTDNHRNHKSFQKNKSIL